MNFDSKLNQLIEGLTTCMQAGMEGCDQETKAQMQNVLDKYTQGYAQVYAEYNCTSMYYIRPARPVNIYCFYQNKI